MSRLLSMQTSKHKEKCFICRRCINPFNTKERLREHLESCSKHDAVKTKLPQEGSVLKFKHFFKSMRVPFVVYADFESFTQQLDTSQPNPECSYTKQYQKHIPSGFCYYIKCCYAGYFLILVVRDDLNKTCTKLMRVHLVHLIM